MIILGIETSCDETAIALIEFNKKGIKRARGIQGIKRKEEFPKIKILADKVSSQIKIHAPFGGVVPGLAAREHVQNLPILFKRVEGEIREKRDTRDVRMDFMDKIDLIAITNGPGLMPCLLVGVAFARALAYKYQKPIIGVNHLEGHLLSSFLNLRSAIGDWQTIFPALGLIVSGGHTELVLMKKFGDYQLLGETLDDAAGEAFDKVARLLDLGYPGGPVIEKSAKKGNAAIFNFPRPMIESKDYNFSFAGLKTAVLYKIRDIEGKSGKIKENEVMKKNMAAAFQEAVIETLVKKTEKALQSFKIKTLIAGGGVLANSKLRQGLKKMANKKGVKIFLPQKCYSGDNASMVALAAYFNRKKAVNWQKIEADPNLSFNKIN